MATSTANKGYVVPTVGADRNQWGTQLNQNLNQLDKNIGGVLNPVDVSGIGDFNVSAANAQIMAHVLTGALTGTRNYVFPAGVHGFWFISNNTSGNFSLFVKSAGGGLNLEILQGNAVVLWSDGVSIVLLGSTYEQLAAISERVMDRLRENPNFQRPRMNYQPTSPRVLCAS